MTPTGRTPPDSSLPDSTPDPPAAASRPRLAVAGAAVAVFAVTLAGTVVAVALQPLQRDLGAGLAGLQGLVTAYTVTFAALLLPAGALVDRLGRRRTLLAGLLVFAAASAGCALAGSTAALVLLRGMQGAGAALVLPASLAVVAGARTAPAARARAVAVWAAAGALALSLGPLVGGLLVSAVGWQGVFWVELPVCALAAVAVPAARDLPVPRPRALDLPGMALSVLALAAFAYGVVLLGSDGVRLPAVAALVVAAAAGVLLLVVEARSAEPLLPLAVLRDGVVAGSAVAALAVSLATFVLLVFLSLFLQLVQSRSALETGLALLPLTVVLVLVALPAARWAAARGPREPVVVGLVLAAGGVLVLALQLQADTGRPLLGALLLLVGAGLGLTTAPVVTATLGALDDDDRHGLAGALVTAARELGGVLAVAGIGAVEVARLRADAVAQLQAQGGPPAAVRDVVDALVSGRTSPVELLSAAAGRIDLLLLLELPHVLSQSFVTATRVALEVTVLVLVLAAGLAAATLPHRPEPVREPGELPPGGGAALS